MEWHEWVETGRLYVRNVTGSREDERELWYGTLRGDGSIHIIARHDPSENPPTLYVGQTSISVAYGPRTVRRDYVIEHVPATDEDLQLFIGKMVRRISRRPLELPFEWWVRTGLLPEEAERIRRVWVQRTVTASIGA